MRPLLVSALIFSIFSSIGCKTTGADRPLNPAGFKSIDYGYYAIDPIEIPESQGASLITRNGPDPDLARLTSIGTVTSQKLATSKGSLNATFGGVSGNTEKINLYSDNLVYRCVVKRYKIKVEDKDGSPIEYEIPVSLVVGVGSRIEGKMDTSAGELNITGIPGFSAAASGSIKSAEASVHTIGIISPTIVKMPRFTGELTKENLYTFFQSLALINSSIYESTTEVFPHIMGFYASALPDDVKPYHITNAIRWEASAANNSEEITDTSLKIIPEVMTD